MTKTQRIALALFIMGWFNLSGGDGLTWFSAAAIVLGWLGFVSNNIGARFLYVAFFALFAGGRLYRRIRGLPEPAR